MRPDIIPAARFPITSFSIIAADLPNVEVMACNAGFRDWQVLRDQLVPG